MLQKKYIQGVLCLLLVFTFSFLWIGCKKKDSNNVKTDTTPADFPGEYKGYISAYRHGKMVNRSVSLSICTSNDGVKLQGIMYSNDINVLSPTNFSEGILYFRVICNDSLNSKCLTWNEAGYVYFDDDGYLEMYISGNECGDLGDEYFKWSGTLKRESKEPDPDHYFSFPKQGTQWTYKIMWDTYDTCTAIRLMTSGKLNEYTGTTTYPCLFPQSRSFKWTVIPAAFIMEGDSLLNPCPITTVFRIDHKVNNRYRYIQGGDTMYLTCTGRGNLIQTPMGITPYYVYERDCHFHPDGRSIHYVSTFFISPRLGILNVINYQYLYSYYVRNVDLDTITYSK
ncbi:MAG: hypothetical protein Q8867_00090 [Bacteroidota bacterium]|nr:hypothetical protein [Bacteroidota bacterium]